MEHITCQFCHQPFDEPALLQCKHPVCFRCLQGQFSFDLPHKRNDSVVGIAKQAKMRAHRDISIRCPVCKEKTTLLVTHGITMLTRDMELDEKGKNTQEETVIMCCKDDGMKATLYCESCEKNYCKEWFERQHSETLKNHKATVIDPNSPPTKSAPPTTCSKHGHLLDMFCKRDQVECCYQCFESGKHKGHEPTFVSHITEKIKKEVDGQLIKIDEQINKIRQTLSKMDSLKEQVTLSHKQFREQAVQNFDRIIAQLAKKKDELVEKSKKMEGSSLNNIMMQQQALGDLLKQKTDMVEQANKLLSGSDLQVGQCKQLLQRNQEIIYSMLVCCESGKMSTVDLSPVEQLIDKLGPIVKIPVDLKLPTVSGLKECQRNKTSVTLQWDPVKCDFPEMNFVVQTRVGNNDKTVKNYKVPSNVTSLRMPVAEIWKQLVCTVHCEIDEQFQGEKCVPLTIYLVGDDPQAILHHLKEKCSQTTYERVQQVFSQKGIQLDLNDCCIDDGCAIAFAKMLPHLTQLQKLNLHTNQIGDIGATAISNSITKLIRLQILDLSCNQIGDTGATTIANAIIKLTRLRGLSLNDNQIGNTGATAISNSIITFTRLQLLDLGGNQIGDTGAIAIANSISNLTQLQQLHLGINQIGDTGTIAIANSITKLQQLQQLHLGSNQIGDTGATSLANSIINLTQLQQLLLFNNNIREPVKQLLKQKFGDKLDIRVDDEVVADDDGDGDKSGEDEVDE